MLILSPEHCDPAGLPAAHKIECNLLSHFQYSLTRNVCPDCSEPRVVVLGIRMEPYFGDNLAKDIQSHFIRGPWLKQHNFHSKTYASNSKHHIYDRNMCPKHRDVNWMVYNRVIRFEMSPPEPFEICYFG